MAKSFVNLNRFKHGRTIKRNSKRRRDLQTVKEIRERKERFTA